jgi:serine/threonine protein kinase
MLERRRHGMARDGYVLMEKLDETLPLHEFLQSLSALPPAQRRRILDERIRLVARGVREMHRRQLCHRDLKANNILLAEVGAWRAGACPEKPWATPTFLDDLLPGMWFIDLVGVTLHRKLSQRRKVQNLARLNASFHASPHLSRTDRLRFLRGYLVCGLVGSQGWKTWWRRIAAATQAKVTRNQRRGRTLA